MHASERHDAVGEEAAGLDEDRAQHDAHPEGVVRLAHAELHLDGGRICLEVAEHLVDLHDIGVT